MTFNPVSSDPFEHYFYKRAQLADEMALVGHVVDTHTLATASLDALAVKCQLHRHINLRVFFSLLEWARSPLRNLKRRDRDFSETTTITLLY